MWETVYRVFIRLLRRARARPKPVSPAIPRCSVSASPPVPELRGSKRLVKSLGLLVACVPFGNRFRRSLVSTGWDKRYVAVIATRVRGARSPQPITPHRLTAGENPNKNGWVAESDGDDTSPQSWCATPREPQLT